MKHSITLRNRHGGGEYKQALNETEMPDIPSIDWDKIGRKRPEWVSDKQWDSDKNETNVDIVIITWTSAEWASFNHVFCDSGADMPYKYYEAEKEWREYWKYYHNNWDKIKSELTDKSPSLSHEAWGSCRVVKLPSNDKNVLLFKSDMHVSTDGKDLPLRSMLQQIIDDFNPRFIFTIGTAGGSRIEDNLGTVNVTNCAHFDLTGEFTGCHYPFNNKTYCNSWEPVKELFDKISSSLMETPVTKHDLEMLRNKNAEKLIDPETGKTYELSKLANSQIEPGKIPPIMNVLDNTPVLTTNGYVVGNTSGNYKDYAAMEMDDAVIGLIADKNSILFGIVRNISDPVQNASLASEVQGQWGGIIYSEYGLYTSYNGALVTWALVDAMK